MNIKDLAEDLNLTEEQYRELVELFVECPITLRLFGNLILEVTIRKRYGFGIYT